MLRKFLDFHLNLSEKGKPLERMRPLFNALDTFCFEPMINRVKRPFIQDAVDLKRWMVLVVIALFPCILMAIWNTGVQSFVYTSSDAKLFSDYLEASRSFSGYFSFTFSEGRWLTILAQGALGFLPLMFISYAAGGLAEGFFAAIRRHEISEGFLVSGMLYALIIPASTPYWVAAVGIIGGIVLSKELFGGTGMNILNPAMTARALLFFTFPGNMTGDVWISTDPYYMEQSLAKINEQAHNSEVDGYTSATALQNLTYATTDVKRIHVDTIAHAYFGKDVPLLPVIQEYFEKWKKESQNEKADLKDLDLDTLKSFMTTPVEKGGLGIMPANLSGAFHETDTIYGTRKFSLGNLFFGNIPGSMGETSKFAIILGALLLILTGVGSWRTMAGYIVGALLMASFFFIGARFFGPDQGAWNPAQFAMWPYKHLLIGSMAFGLVFMATDPVSSPQLSRAKWAYGILIGIVTILIRLINPAYPEGVMLAILFGNVFGPLFDHIALQRYGRRKLA